MREATLVRALYYCCFKCDVNLSNQCSLTPPCRVAGGGWRCGSGGQEPGWSIRSIHCRGCHHRARAAAHQPAVQTPVSQLLSSSHCHHETPAVATLQPRPHHDGGGLGRPPPAVPPSAAPPRPRPRPRDQRRPRQEEEDRRQVSRAGGDAREAGVGYKHTMKIAFMLLLCFYTKVEEMKCKIPKTVVKRNNFLFSSFPNSHQ